VDYSRPPGEVNFCTLSPSLAMLFGLGFEIWRTLSRVKT